MRNNKWKLLSEEKPPKIGWYIVYCNDDCMYFAFVAANGYWNIQFPKAYGDMGKPFVRNSKYIEREVIYWRKLITPPKGSVLEQQLAKNKE